jgi:hypothetical protein
MSAAEAPKSEQIQANVAAALSRLRGELGAASSPVASPTPIPMPKVGAEPAPAEPLPEPLPAGPVRTAEAAAGTGAVRPFEPILNAMSGGLPSNDSEPAKPEGTKPELFGRLRADPNLATDRAAAAAIVSANGARPDNQPDLLTGMEVPPAPPPPLGSFEAEDEVNGRGRRMRNRLLVLAALVVIAGGATWAWVSSHRAPEGPVPVIAADTTPEKVKPEDEGGMQVPNQNVEILNGQSSAEQPETVLPPPEQPVAPPTTETTDQANAAPQAPAITDEPKPAEPAPTTDSATDQSAATPSVAAPAIPSVTAPEPGQAAAAPTPIVPEPQTQQAAPAPAEAAPAPATTAEKPAEPAPAPAAPKAAEPTQTAAAPASPSVAPTAGGNSRIQLAAVKSAAAANTQWTKLQKAHPALLGALSLNVQKVQVNGATYYRIQAGPLSRTQAKDLCSKLKAQKQDCIVAK